MGGFPEEGIITQWYVGFISSNTAGQQPVRTMHMQVEGNNANDVTLFQLLHIFSYILTLNEMLKLKNCLRTI